MQAIEHSFTTGMKRYIVLSIVLMTAILLCGCTEDPGVSAPTNRAASCPDCCGETVLAIGIALNDSEVRTYLADSYSIADVNPNATVTLLLDGTYTTIDIIDVMIDSPGNLVHVYVDTPNCTVISIWTQAKQMPVEPPLNTITINPVDDHLVGDVFTVSGTSPLPAANLLFIEIIPVDFKPPPWEEYPGLKTTLSGKVQTVEYQNGISRWYYAVNSTSLLPNVYEVWVWSNPNDPYWEGVSTEFNLSAPI
jgi:hypothetical protein